MTELAFTKSFLSTLDSKPVKLRADHVFDPDRVGLRVPVLKPASPFPSLPGYTLPRLQPPRPEMPKKVKRQQAPGSLKSINIHLKSARNPSLDFTVSNAPISTTSVEDMKEAVREKVVDSSGGKITVEKIKILYKRKPVTGKTVAEMLVDEPEMLTGGKEVELGVMIIGGAKAVEADAQEEKRGGEDGGGKSVERDGELHTEAFWDDLQGFLGQRLKDDAQARKLRGLFKDAWSSSR
ncbi:hypothetical protein PHISCL_00181 [Aspergillus sclerotialis]|uniref:Cell-cycle control medial ring component n=1 Tax=Aspergillus sclerotialis TaxID=2070753 RepID=A0A3A3A1J1_9EURO|nr:hypothetical protein PHISCL_00181 [Aspergillus sclerotialis]